MGLLLFHLLIALLLAATLRQWIPTRLFHGLLRDLHSTIGISTPTDRQVRWTLAVWLISVLVIVDGMILLLQTLAH
jgi:hypothetical protein